MRNLLFVPAACLVALLLASPRPARAQATPTATRTGVLQAGVTYSNASTDFVSKRIGGVSAYATFDLYKNFGLEADVHFLSLWTPQDYAQQSYLAGVRYSRHIRRYQPYVRVLGGIAQTVAQQDYVRVLPQTPEKFGALAFGAGVDVHMSHNINIRAIDFEQQFWPNFQPNGLTPKIISAGLAYRFR